MTWMKRKRNTNQMMIENYKRNINNYNNAEEEKF